MPEQNSNTQHLLKPTWITRKQADKFHRVAPVWNRMLQIGIFEKDSNNSDIAYEINDYNSCIVGEAHSFDAAYNECDICHEFSRLFMDSSPYTNNDHSKFKQTMTKFLKHFEAKHEDLMDP